MNVSGSFNIKQFFADSSSPSADGARSPLRTSLNIPLEILRTPLAKQPQTVTKKVTNKRKRQDDEINEKDQKITQAAKRARKIPVSNAPKNDPKNGTFLNNDNMLPTSRTRKAVNYFEGDSDFEEKTKKTPKSKRAKEVDQDYFPLTLNDTMEVVQETQQAVPFLFNLASNLLESQNFNVIEDANSIKDLVVVEDSVIIEIEGGFEIYTKQELLNEISPHRFDGLNYDNITAIRLYRNPYS